jgi:putative transposase
MPRKLRCIEPTAIYHGIPRFVGQEFFIESQEERLMYLRLFGLAVRHSDWRCFAYAIMSNHIHLALVAGQHSLASWMRPVHTDFAQWLNKRRERIGAIFTRGPNMRHVMPSGAARLISYIHCNPVRAGLVSDPGQSDWSSHRAYLGTGYRPQWLDVETGLKLSGFENGAELDRWMACNPTSRSDLEVFHTESELGSDPITPQTESELGSDP